MSKKYKKDKFRYSKSKGKVLYDIDPRLKVSEEAKNVGLKPFSKEVYKKRTQRKIYRKHKSVEELLEQAQLAQKDRVQNVYGKDIVQRFGLSKVYKSINYNYLNKIKTSEKKIYLQKFIDIRSGAYETYINKNYEKNLLTALKESNASDLYDIMKELIDRGRLDNETIRELSQNDDVQYLMSFYDSEDIDDAVSSITHELLNKGLIVFNNRSYQFEVRDLRRKYADDEDYDIGEYDEDNEE